MKAINADPFLARPGQPSSDVFGLVITVLNPAPPSLISLYEKFGSNLKGLLRDRGVFDTDYLLYSSQNLHCTVATVRPFAKSAPECPNKTISFWIETLKRFEDSPNWQRDIAKAQISLLAPKVFDDGVCVFMYKDESNVLGSMRNCLRKHMASLRTEDITIDDVNMQDVKIPNIVHSTFLRWRKPPNLCTGQMQHLLDKAYAEAVAAHVMRAINIGCVRLLKESQPFMQMLECCYEAPVRTAHEACTQGDNAD